MSALQISREGLRALAAHKLRTFLMMLGTILGIASLVVVVAISKATETEVNNRVGDFQFNIIKINAGGGKGYTKPSPDVVTLKPADTDAIRQLLGDRAEIVTSVAQKGKVSMKAGDKECQAGVYAVDSDWHNAMSWHATGVRKDGKVDVEAAQALEIADVDVATDARVAVLGARTAADLFGAGHEQDAVDQDIQIGANRFHVKGVLEFKKASPGGEDENSRAVIPLTTGLKRVFNQQHISYIRVRLPAEAVRKDPGLIARTADEIRGLLHERHQITPPAQDDFSIVTAADVAEAARGISGTLTTLLAALTGLALLVGGIVMMNIMLVSVTQRTREIGLRRAIGATHGAIFTQFLAETLVVTLIGAAIGTAIGLGVTLALPYLTTVVRVEVSWEPFALGAALAMAVGLVFGIQPARRAARLKPVDALRS
jgi:putative ABC transport system permease protein